jgi:hypothetical protein
MSAARYIATPTVVLALLGCAHTTQLQPDPPHPPSVLKAPGLRMYRKGQADARRDIALNHLILMGAHPSQRFRKLLSQRYNIDMGRGDPYFWTDESYGYETGYDSISIPEMERRYGKWILERVLAEAEKKHHGR